MASIAIITPYKQQELAMKARYDREKDLHGMRSVYFGTVDGFQVSTDMYVFGRDCTSQSITQTGPWCA